MAGDKFNMADLNGGWKLQNCEVIFYKLEKKVIKFIGKPFTGSDHKLLAVEITVLYVKKKNRLQTRSLSDLPQ